MELHALRPYEDSLQGGTSLELLSADGHVIELDVGRWIAAPDAADATVLSRCGSPTLDVGCGPGRFASALIARGIPAMGIDIAETAVRLTRERGTPALHRSVFDRVPGAGRWPTILLMDGNIGIGGDPLKLLTRMHNLLAAGGALIVEAHADDSIDAKLLVRFARSGHASGPVFPWAAVGGLALARYASAAGFAASESWMASGRRFEVFEAKPR